MKLGNTLALLALLLAVGAVVLWQLRSEKEGVHDVDLRLFEGVDVNRVTAIRVDNIRRSLNLRLERDAAGEWYITDPILYPAAPSIVKLLLEDVAGAKMMTVPQAEQGEEELGFDPPDVVLEVDEKTDAGTVTHRVEIGARDLDGTRVNVRVDGRYYRALVRLYTTLNRDLPEFRSLQALSIPPQEVVEVHRTGEVIEAIEQPPVDYETHAFLDGDTWRSTLPYEATLDPLDFSVLLAGTAGLRIDRFVEDEPSDLADYALDHPLVRVEVVARSQERQALLLSRRGNAGAWFLMREGAPHVWRIEDEKAGRILYPFALMLERHFMRVTRRDVEALTLSRPGSEVRVERRGVAWTVAERRGGGEWGVPGAASARAIEDALARLEELEVGGFFVDEPAPPDALAAGWPAGVRIEGAGRSWGGGLGGGVEREDGEDAVLFRRDGDEVVGWIDPWLAELARTPLDLLRSTDLSLLVEVELTALSISRGDERRRYERDRRGIWREVGHEEEAVRLLPLLDPLIFLRASEHLATPEELVDPIEVEFTRFQGAPVRFRVGGGGTTAAPASRIELGGGVSLAKIADLHERLAGLLGG